ncbi:MAG: VOC family protein [Acidimicrobiaceae bacterium]|nr:VOC family protein [Ilumatobacter sp.]MCB9379854.1 VOC family protein [Acidimicrobiaceae bacterium]MCO5328912.1 VOC family protein [Ilumatobacteraceae bacterium]
MSDQPAMHIHGMVHVNINCRNFDRSRAFYEMLGFQVVWMVPATNTVEVAAAVGMPPYRVNGAIMAVPGARPPLVIDLLEWVEPRDESDPYPNLYRPGLARLAMRTTDLEADLRRLVEEGVEIVGAPATVMVDERRGSRFVCFRDPDGTFLELVEAVEVPDGDPATG